MSNVTLDTLTRAEAHRKLLALGMSADVAADYLDSEASLTARLAVSLACPGAWPILEAYQRHCKNKIANESGPSVTDYYDVIAREVAAYHARTAGPEFQPGYHHPDPVIDQEAVRSPSHVLIPRAVLESLVDATERAHGVRKAREAAERALSLDAIRYEPARTDPEAARQLAEARAGRDSGDASLEADDPSPIERLAREFDRAAFKQGCGAINHDRGDCYRDAAKRMRAVAAEYLGLTEEQAGNVQSVRRRLGLTQERLGVEIGYRSETISRWENGREAVPRVVRLALIGLIASHGEHDANRGAK